MTLTKNYHHMFAEFEIYFTRLDGPTYSPHTYRIEAFVPLAMRKELPATRTLRAEGAEANGKPIALPEPRFLALRSALAHVLYRSSAGSYIDDLLTKLKEKPTKENGSTELGLFAQLKLDGWCPSSTTTTANKAVATNTIAAASIVAVDTNTAAAAADTAATAAADVAAVVDAPDNGDDDDDDDKRQ